MLSPKTRIIALAITGVVALTGVAEASGPAKTTVTIKTQNGDFSGTVKSRRLHRCADQRTITLYKQVGSHQNRSVDQEVGSDTSELHGNHGTWSTGNTGLRSGKFYAYAARKPGCKAASSKTVRA